MITRVNINVMRHLVAFLLLVGAASHAAAGVTYRFVSTSEGVAKSTIVGNVRAEGPMLRMDVEKGDGKLFRDGDAVYSTDGGRTLDVVNPALKTYYRLSSDDMARRASALLAQFGDSVRIAVTGAKVNRRDLGAGELVDGFRTSRSALTTSHELSIDILGQKVALTISIDSQTWTTDQLPHTEGAALDFGSARTGIAAIDEVLAAQAPAKKGFPLRQVSRVTIEQNGRKTTSTTRVEMQNVLRRRIAPSVFAIPKGLQRVAGPFDGL